MGHQIPLEFKPYLLSMVSHYDFLILTDKALECYIDPVTYSGSNPRWFKFYYNEEKNQVEAFSYRYDRTLGGLEGCTEQDAVILRATEVKENNEVVGYTANPWCLTDCWTFLISVPSARCGRWKLCR